MTILILRILKLFTLLLTSLEYALITISLTMPIRNKFKICWIHINWKIYTKKKNNKVSHLREVFVFRNLKNDTFDKSLIKIAVANSDTQTELAPTTFGWPLKYRDLVTIT